MMKRRQWMIVAISLLCVITLTGCQVLNAFGLLPNSHDSKKEIPLSYTDMNTATPLGKAIATKPAGKTTSVPTAKPKAATENPQAATGRIAFISQRDSYEIWVMNADGSDQQQLTTIGEHTVNPAWSPDGTKLTFISDKFGQDYGTAEVFICNADGTGVTQLTINRYNEFQPSFSPDGSKIVYASDRDDNYDIYIMNADGTGETRLTTEPGVDWQPDWSHDGQRIVFGSVRDGKSLNLYTINPDGSNVQRLTDTLDNNTEPTFSADGELIAYITDYADGSNALCVINLDGSGQKELLTSANGDIVGPDWSPDGTRLTYANRPAGGVRSEIFIMNADGSNPTRITENAFADLGPVWKPE